MALRSEGFDAVGVPADIRSAEALADLVGGVAERMGSIDILIANGGGPPAKPATELTDADWEAVFPLIFLFVPRLCNLVLPGMRERGWGRIVAINSVSARQPIANLALSNSLRPAVVGYLKTLSQEVAADGVTVNTVLPGYTRTDRQEELASAAAARTGKSREEIFAAWAANTSAGRLGEPEEIARAVMFLAADEAGFITGSTLTVNGGQYHA